MIDLEELFSNKEFAHDRDIVLIRFDKILAHPSLYSRYKPIITAGKYIGHQVYENKSYFIFESAAKNENVKNQDKFFDSVKHFSEGLVPLDEEKGERQSVLVDNVLFFPRQLNK